MKGSVITLVCSRAFDELTQNRRLFTATKLEIKGKLKVA